MKPSRPRADATVNAAQASKFGCLERRRDELEPEPVTAPRWWADRSPVMVGGLRKSRNPKGMIGKRVEVTGRIHAKAGDATGQPPASAQTNKTDRVIGLERIDLPEFEGANIHAVSGSYPAKPTTKR